jgi:hypothetical protein
MRRRLSVWFLPLYVPTFAFAQHEVPVEVQTSRLETLTIPEGAAIDRHARNVTRPLVDRGAGRCAEILEREHGLAGRRPKLKLRGAWQEPPPIARSHSPRRSAELEERRGCVANGRGSSGESQGERARAESSPAR